MKDKLITHEGQMYRVMMTQIIGTDFQIYAVYEPSQQGEGHSSLWTEPHPEAPEVKFWGEVKSRRLPPELDKLPALTHERLEAVQGFFKQLKEKSYPIILAAFPDLANKGWFQRDGEIVNY